MLVHQIWIGSKPPPLEWMNTVQEFCKTHGHRYILWGNQEIKQLRLQSYPGILELFMHFLQNNEKDKYPAMADILRYVILYEYGGIYIDADTVVLKPDLFDSFLKENNRGIVLGWEKDDESLIANGIILCQQYHFLMKDIIDQLPVFCHANQTKAVWEKTGPGFVTDFYYKTGRFYNGEILIVPRPYFYPVDWHGIQEKDAHTRMKLPPESMLFQYGYSTNNLATEFQESPKQKSSHMYLIFIALGTLYTLSWATSKRH